AQSKCRALSQVATDALRQTSQRPLIDWPNRTRQRAPLPFLDDGLSRVFVTPHTLTLRRFDGRKKCVVLPRRSTRGLDTALEDCAMQHVQEVARQVRQGLV